MGGGSGKSPPILVIYIDVSFALAGHLPGYRYLLADLSAYSDEELSGGFLLQAVLLVMKYIFRDELPERLPSILGLLEDLPRQQSELDYPIPSCATCRGVLTN